MGLQSVLSRLFILLLTAAVAAAAVVSTQCLVRVVRDVTNLNRVFLIPFLNILRLDHRLINR